MGEKIALKVPHNTLLALYSGAVTAALLVVFLYFLAPGKKKATFDELAVQRINIIEPDGTLRLVVSNKTRFPGFIKKGKEHPHARPGSGLLFYNDEGTENGGLVFGGRKGVDGKVSAGGSLTFDQYEQDQVIQLVQSESGGQRTAGLKINDVPETPIDLSSAVQTIRQRIFVGKKPDHSALIVLRDQQERKRIVIEVAPDGTPRLQFLDEKGKVISELPPKDKG